MNYQPLQAETFTSSAAMIRAYSARRARLMTPAHKPVPEAPKEEPKPAEIVVLYRDQYPKDAHVRSWEAWKAGQGSPLKQYIKQRCEELEVSYEKVVGPCRLRRFVDVRQLIMWELKKIVKPTISYPELARLFGRDHSTAIHSVKKIEAEKSKEQA